MWQMLPKMFSTKWPLHSCQLTVSLHWYEAQLSRCSFRNELLGLQAPARCGQAGVSLAQPSGEKHMAISSPTFKGCFGSPAFIVSGLRY